ATPLRAAAVLLDPGRQGATHPARNPLPARWRTARSGRGGLQGIGAAAPPGHWRRHPRDAGDQPGLRAGEGEGGVVSANNAEDLAAWAALPLSEHHRDQLIASAITPAVAIERGYATLTTKSAIKRLGFAESQCLPPGYVLPIHGVGGEL